MVDSPPLVDLVRSVSTAPSNPSAEDSLGRLDHQGVPHYVSDFFDDEQNVRTEWAILPPSINDARSDLAESRARY